MHTSNDGIGVSTITNRPIKMECGDGTVQWSSLSSSRVNILVIFEDAIRAVISEKEVALDCVHLLEAEKQETETTLTALKNEFHDAHNLCVE